MACSFEINPEFWQLSILAASSTYSPVISRNHVFLDKELLAWLNDHGEENRDWYISHQHIKSERHGTLSRITIMLKNNFDVTDIIEFKMRWAL
jgi:hypothetical protein